MNKHRYPSVFKDEAVRQITKPGHSVADVSDRHAAFSHSLRKWVITATPSKDAIKHSVFTEVIAT